jgi:hypothetical protein
MHTNAHTARAVPYLEMLSPPTRKGIATKGKI